jgi:cytochrome P450
MGVNYASKYIPLIVDMCRKRITDWEGQVDLEMKVKGAELEFGIMTTLLFGSDITEVIEDIDYQSFETGKIERVNISEAMARLFDDNIFIATLPHNNIIPQIYKYKVGKINQILLKNATKIVDVTKKFLSSKDAKEGCVYQQLVSKSTMDPKHAFNDMLLYLIGGVDPTTAGFTRVLYQIWAYPEGKKRIRKEVYKHILENGKIPLSDLNTAITAEKIEQMEYTTCFIKEMMRIGGPSH